MRPQEQLEQLHQRIRACTACRLAETRTQAVPGEGPVPARVMFIGEAPGATEDKRGRPFVGRAGKFLEQLLARIGLSREEVFISNVVKCRPPNNRDPRRDELTACRAYWQQQLELVNPQVVVLLGLPAVQAVLGLDKLGDCRGQFLEREGRYYFSTYHPAAALRFERFRDPLRTDFQTLGDWLRAHPPSPTDAEGPDLT